MNISLSIQNSGGKNRSEGENKKRAAKIGGREGLTKKGDWNPPFLQCVGWQK
jgi:hypothetical protein